MQGATLHLVLKPVEIWIAQTCTWHVMEMPTQAAVCMSRHVPLEMLCCAYLSDKIQKFWHKVFQCWSVLLVQLKGDAQAQQPILLIVL